MVERLLDFLFFGLLLAGGCQLGTYALESW